MKEGHRKVRQIHVDTYTDSHTRAWTQKDLSRKGIRKDDYRTGGKRNLYPEKETLYSWSLPEGQSLS